MFNTVDLVEWGVNVAVGESRGKQHDHMKQA